MIVEVKRTSEPGCRRTACPLGATFPSTDTGLVPPATSQASPQLVLRMQSQTVVARSHPAS